MTMILVKCLCVMMLMLSAARGEEEEDIYSNSWAVEVAGGVEAARKIAEKHGFVHMGQVGLWFCLWF